MTITLESTNRQVVSALGLHIIEFPSGRFGFVGSLPTAMATAVPATTSDVMGGRSFRASDGTVMTWSWPTFASAADAVAFAAGHGYVVRT